MRVPLIYYRITRYEYWPGWLFYLPLLPYWLYLSARMRSFSFFTLTNPGMDLGGFFGESKQDILKLLPKDYLPKQLFVDKSEIHDIANLLQQHHLQFPLIAKPDVGERGAGVEKMHSPEELTAYLSQSEGLTLIQEFIDYPEEFGVFYCRIPGNVKGKITSLTRKQFLTVTGNGKDTVEQLLQQSVRARFQLKRLRKYKTVLLQSVPVANETVLVEPIGNHCRGTAFLDGSAAITTELEQVFDRIAAEIPGFYYGRFDIKVKSLEELRQGKTIRIMELNGISSEPGHIYDKNMSLLRAYRVVARHWQIMSEIARANRSDQTAELLFRSLVVLYVKHVVLGKAVRKIKDQDQLLERNRLQHLPHLSEEGATVNK